MKNYPKIGIRPIIDGRQGGIRESLEEKTMNLAKAVAELISNNLKNGDIYLLKQKKYQNNIKYRK